MFTNLTLIDDAILGDHYYLSDSDYCTFMGEYTARRGYGYSDTNQLISNFKKDPSRRGMPEWRYKRVAIATIGNSLAHCLHRYVDQFSLVPIPPSKCKDDPAYDDRMVQALAHCQRRTPQIDFRELVYQTSSTRTSHGSDDRLGPDELLQHYAINHELVDGTRGTILVVDDLITTGSHFKAMQRILHECLPDRKIVGLFIARRVPESDFDII
ncbi:hypothetical protein [Candidatus Thiodiazotropha endoloripes]|uniref:hypothetical protein n=1 Tax=Candidatus Thiodiazotropha endoloripes TaxID=1818881 RepID=UPI001112426F|nr:hypothetical protein [Candidatus Thiodiazotropha endoloripes]